ncbi:hypothetical protein ACO2Q7_15720 [Rathayibacter sp. KR2-224]|uniref:hypothetical protein n=1 Tax=Rathayibacter sp. KR2-224 TaxID=3400913 RepID=UPI003BFBD095
MPERERDPQRARGPVFAEVPGDIVIAIAAAVSVIALMVLAAVVFVPSGGTPSSARFTPGLIISDFAFYDSASMSQAQVERFLETRQCVPAEGSPCLADYRQDTPDEPTEYAHCAAYHGASNEPASAIIVKIGRACGISPKVLLVLLQKEQSLLTHPTASGYQRATGYGCPDTAACDANYFGFFNQLYNAAWQFREYTVDGASWRYHVGRVAIQYHPNAACGSSMVDIRDQATANLYNYTPYQPSPQTLKRPGAVSDCSTFGNFNFWRLYKEWFGSPLAQRFPPQYDGCLNLRDGARCFPDPVTGL